MKIEDLELFRFMEDDIMKTIDKYTETIKELCLDMSGYGMATRSHARRELKEFLHLKLSDIVELSSECSDNTNDVLVKELCKYISSNE